MECEPVAILRSPYRDKFGVPRQSGIVEVVESTVELLPPYNRPEAVAGLEGFSHLWLQFHFHLNDRQRNRGSNWQPMVRPPRLGGNRKVGVFASRAPFRPNPIGLSVVRIVAILAETNRVEIRVSGADLVDETPILDIKPYIPYADAIPHANAGFAPAPPPQRPVHFSPSAEARLQQLDNHPQLRNQITAILALDPRPAYRAEKQEQRQYGIRLHHWDIRWHGVGEAIEVIEILDPKELI
jgi:tRNA-Thr(GGU) m(6)t(6)A37 methyltransferase TsaA